MEAKSIERKRTATEKVRKDKIVEEEVYDEVEEEDESGAGLAEEDKKKGVGGSGRRGPSGGCGVSQPSCQAERCGSDLTDAKRYHRRHKVCEFHSKAPVVMVAGLRQRFCQQCSRFHDLGEFDEAKRSCRRRLSEHNERRRKSTAETYNDGCNRSKGNHPLDSRCRHVDDRERRGQMNISQSSSSGSKSFGIR